MPDLSLSSKTNNEMKLKLDASIFSLIDSISINLQASITLFDTLIILDFGLCLKRFVLTVNAPVESMGGVFFILFIILLPPIKPLLASITPILLVLCIFILV